MVQLRKWVVVVLALALVVALATPAFAAELKGKIKSVSADKKELVVTDKDNKDMTFSLSDTAQIQLADNDITLKELKTGEEVTVTYEKKGDKLVATKVHCEKK